MRRKKTIAVVMLLVILPVIDEALAKWELSKYPQDKSISPVYIWYKPRVSKFLSLKIAEHYGEVQSACCKKYAVIYLKRALPLKLEYNETDKMYEELRILYSEQYKILSEIPTTNDTKRLYELVWRYSENQEQINKLKRLDKTAVLNLGFSWISFYSFIFHQFGFLIGIVLFAIFLEQFERKVKVNEKLKDLLIVTISALVVFPLILYGLPLGENHAPRYLDMHLEESSSSLVYGNVSCYEEWNVKLNDESVAYLKSVLPNLTVGAVYDDVHIYAVTLLLNESQRNELFRKLSELTEINVPYTVCSVNKSIETALKVEKTAKRLYVDGYLSKEQYERLSLYCDEVIKKLKRTRFVWDYEVHMSFR
ncbi:hypothetical protein [Thermococcus sp. LS2]|uniref:hypothetical protein n=1 Tax=Thermococcus sp. LS2 TaxID=1638260 RepID=UPI00143C6AC1|nr:hypothetical protein [Thermococcus sp. LS2]NJE11775.1 hypothetical protein [Thermococcus sp. LS2]